MRACMALKAAAACATSRGPVSARGCAGRFGSRCSTAFTSRVSGAHREAGAEQQQEQLHQQHQRQPAGQRHRGRRDVDGQRAAVAQAQEDLEVRTAVGHLAQGQRILTVEGAFDGVRGNRRVGQRQRLAGLAGVEAIAVGASFQARQPGLALGGRQAVEHGYRDRHVLFEAVEHHVLRGLVALVELRGEGQPVGQHQPGEEDQRQARGEAARARHGELHGWASTSRTSSENT